MIISALDIETTGLLDPEHRLVEIYATLRDTKSWQRQDFLYYRINPGRSISADAQRVHKISFTDVANEPTWDQIGPTVWNFLQRADLFVAHNVDFDYEFLQQEFQRIGLPKLTTPTFCTMKNSIWATSTGKNPSLQELCFAMGVDYDPSLSHAAEYDVERMEECLEAGVLFGWYNFDLLQSTGV